jgi:polyisoprenoid-binding protein YceI
METTTKTKWQLDVAHSEIQFKVKHLMITNVTGKFSSFGAEVETDDNDFSTSTISFWADVNSIDTGNEQRDNHLKSGDFFDGENHAKIQFVGTKLEKLDENKWKLTGDLSIRGVTKEVTLDVEGGILAKDPWGNLKTGFSISGKINRSDFGLVWNAALETGGVLVQDEVKIVAEVQFAKV